MTFNQYHVLVVRAQLTRNIGALFSEIRDESKAAFTDAIPESDGAPLCTLVLFRAWRFADRR